MIQKNNKFSLSREEVAEKLEVSLRTIDRYLKTGKLGHVKLEEEGVLRVFVNEEEVNAILEKRANKRKKEQGSGATEAPKMTQNSQKNEENANLGQEGGREEKTAENRENAILRENEGVVEVYKKLYEETNQRLMEANRRLEGANYRVGELEAQVKSSVPLLEYKEAQEKASQLNARVEKLNQEVAEGAVVNYRLTGEVSEARREIELEKSKRVLYISLLVLFVVLGSFGLFWQNLS